MTFSSSIAEEIMSMLLNLPIDPDASIVELIADIIYGNSKTMDGRRFASDFVSKRKSDTKKAPAVTPANGKTVAVSIADVVKAQPKAAQPEWGYKVVQKKKKGGKA